VEPSYETQVLDLTGSIRARKVTGSCLEEFDVSSWVDRVASKQTTPTSTRQWDFGGRLGVSPDARIKQWQKKTWCKSSRLYGARAAGDLV
jgi:hypothetical protein